MTNEKIIKIVGIYDREEQAVGAVEELKSQGYHQEEISMITNNREMLEKLGIDKPTRSKMNEGAKTGAATGSLIGGLAGLLAGFGAFTIPGIGPILAAGPIAAAFVGGSAGIGVGGITGALIGLGIPEEEANRYEKEMQQEKILVIVEKQITKPLIKPMDHTASERELTEVDPSKEIPKRSAMDQVDPSRYF
ncbi:general stress protein [Mesobacillus maritimus]|uniref:General stress protein n=1 Tax=Mesobacillus maritimus TaxID=1643336 RepID=A0ABS7KAD6_9BACI|nr:general stress protein [Mesobacillus maritimus]MBY0099188.1 general stress protein [Mesobacillus maritimus]